MVSDTNSHQFPDLLEYNILMFMPPQKSTSPIVQSGENRWSTRLSRLALFVAGIWTLLGALNMAVMALTLGFIALPIISAPFILSRIVPTLNPVYLLVSLFLPVLFPLVVFLIAFPLHRFKKYNAAVVLVATSLLILIGLAMCIPFILKYQSEQAAAENALIAAPPPGFLVPTSQSIPPAFTEQFHQYRKNGYLVKYHELTATQPGTLGLSESSVDVVVNYTNDIKSELSMSHNMSSSSFSYNGSPGMIFSYPVYDQPDLINYTLHWNDAGKDLEIDVGDVPKASFAPDAAIKILQSLIRS